MRNSGRIRYYVIEPDDETGDYVIANYNGFNSCRVFVRNHRGVGFQYRFGSKHIETRPELHEEVKATLASFVVDERS